MKTGTGNLASYLELSRSGELRRRVEQARHSLEDCRQCGWQCGANRTRGELGQCQTGRLAFVSSYGPHLGEEGPLRGWRGSGTVFFARCNLACRFCQNADISRRQTGAETAPESLARIFLELQAAGCHNINLVSPTHVAAQILEALEIAAARGLSLPLVYNTGGYDSPETLRLLDGIVDIYLPDMKYWDADTAQRLSGIPEYPATNQAAVIEMHRQVGDLYINQDGLAVTGLLVRHLILPEQLAGTRQVVRFIAEKVSRNTYLNLMNQYYPHNQASADPVLGRQISAREYEEAVEWAHEAGLHRLDQRRGLR